MEQWIVEGVMPERAIDRLQKAGIPIFGAKKVKKMQILFCINKKDLEKAFAIYPNMCYNSKRESVYTFTRVGARSARERKIAKFRLVGAGLGVCLFLAILALSSSYVFRIDVVGANVYEREVLSVLSDHGIKLYSPYQKGVEDAVCAKILTLDGVEFCSMQKSGNAVTVELRLNSFSSAKREEGGLIASRKGVIVNAVALGGTLLKSEGESVEAGETLVGDYFLTGEGEWEKCTQTHVVAKVKLLCEEQVQGETQIAAEMNARLLVETLGGEILEIAPASETESVVTVKYTLVLKKNM